MALLVGVGLAAALAHGLLAALVRWIRLSRAEVGQPTHTWEVRQGCRCEPPPALSVFGASRMSGAPATVELVSGSRSHTVTSNVDEDSVTGIEIPCSAAPRGLYRLRRVTVRFTGLLSLFAVVLEHTVSTGASAAVPLLRVLPVASSVRDTPVFPGFVAGTRADGSSRKRSDDLIEARPYHPGDDTRRINWKAYAHSETLFVRIGEELPPPSLSADIVVDTRGLDSFSDVDRLISAALGVAEELDRREFSVTLSAQVDKRGPRMLGTLREGRRALATVDPIYGFVPDADADRPWPHEPREPQYVGGHTLVVGTDRSPAAAVSSGTPGAAHAILVWDHSSPEGGGRARTISVME